MIYPCAVRCNSKQEAELLMDTLAAETNITWKSGKRPSRDYLCNGYDYTVYVIPQNARGMYRDERSVVRHSGIPILLFEEFLQALHEDESMDSVDVAGLL